jgi:hypothetical protein
LHRRQTSTGLPLNARGGRPTPTKPQWELFDLESDPMEMKNAYDDPEYKDVLGKLKSEQIKLQKKLGDNDEVVIT